MNKEIRLKISSCGTETLFVKLVAYNVKALAIWRHSLNVQPGTSAD
jgi:hypothetical protein